MITSLSPLCFFFLDVSFIVFFLRLVFSWDGGQPPDRGEALSEVFFHRSPPVAAWPVRTPPRVSLPELFFPFHQHGVISGPRRFSLFCPVTGHLDIKSFCPAQRTS